MVYIISADELKKTIVGYKPTQSEKFHHASARLADKMYEEALRSRSERAAILMAGGTASGKSEYISTYLQTKAAIILDGTLPTFEGAKIKIRKAQKAGKQAEVRMVLPASLPVAFIAFLNRERKFSTEHFYRTHSSSRKTVLEIARTYSDIPVKLYISSVDISGTGAKMKMRFKELAFQNRPELVEFLDKNQYTKEEIRNLVFSI